MAKASISMPDEFLEKLSSLGERTDEVCKKALTAGANVVESKVASNLSSVLSGKSTGQLEDSLGVSPAKVNRDGNYDIKIGFSESRTDGKSNAMLASVLEYGKSGQPPRPFMKPAKSSAKSAAIEAMKAVLDEEVRKL